MALLSVAQSDTPVSQRLVDAASLQEMNTNLTIGDINRIAEQSEHRLHVYIFLSIILVVIAVTLVLYKKSRNPN